MTGTNFNNYPSLAQVAGADGLLVLHKADESASSAGTVHLAAANSFGLTVTPSGDATGVTDAAAINAAVSALPATGGVVRLAPTAAWYVECGQVVISTSGVYIDAAGCYVNATGAGDMIRMYDADYGDRTFYGGGLLGFPMVDGSATTGNSCAFHAGDILQLRAYAQVRQFNAGTTSKGVWLDNNYQWTEQGKARVFAQACSTGVVFDNSVNTSGTSTGSFDRFDLTVFVDQQQKGDGVTFQGGAILVDGKLAVYGNFGYHATTAYAVLRITGSNVVNGSSLINGSVVSIGTECYAPSGTVAPQTVAFGSGSGTVTGNAISGCEGVMDFSAADPFAASNNYYNVRFDGIVLGDPSLQVFVNGPQASSYIGSGFASGWGGALIAECPRADGKVFMQVKLNVAGSTVMTNGMSILASGTLPAWALPTDNTLIPVDINGTYASVNIASNGAVTFVGPAQTPSSTVYPYGQAWYSNS